MDLPLEEALKRLNTSTDYKAAFDEAYGKEHITSAMLAMALVAFERTIPPPDSKYQRFIASAQEAPKKAQAMLSESQLEGLHLFRTKAKCMTCHEGALLSDNDFHVTGFHLALFVFQSPKSRLALAETKRVALGHQRLSLLAIRQ